MLGVSEEDKISIRAVLVEISALSFSQAARVQLHATSRRRYLALESLNLPKGFNGYAVNQIPRVGQFIFGGKFLEAVDSDLNMNKRAREVAERFRPHRPDSFRRFHGGRSSLFPSRDRFRGQCSRAGGQARFSLSRYRGGSRARFSDSTPPPPPLSPSDYMVGVWGNCPTPVGGRLSLFVAEWQAITHDHLIISVITHGFQISFHDNFPGVLREVTRAPRDPKALLAIRSEIQELIQKNAIVEVDDFPLLCLSPIFVIPKKTGDLRVILNLKKMNVFIPVQHFRMETLKVILQDLCSHDWAVSIDLKDAYLHVPVHPRSRRLLGFKFLGKAYTYKVLPFGLKDSLWVFSRIVATVIGHLRLQGIRIFYYLDDWLLIAESRPLLESHLLTTLQLSQRLGFIVNWKKSMLTPQRMPIYLGASLDIPRLIARPVEHRVVTLQALIEELTMSWVAPALLWQRFLGHLASLVDLVPNCRLLMRPLQLHFL